MAGLPSNLPQITAADTYIGPIVSNLLMCLCEKASAAPNPPAHCSLRIGLEVPHDLGIDTDLCCEGLAYVALGDMYPSSEPFPQQDSTRQASTGCPPLSWALSIRAGLVRCVPTGLDNGVTITDKEWEAAALQNIYDTQTLQRTACCFRDFITADSDVLGGWAIIIGNITQGNPQGGCVERTVTFQVQVPYCC